MPKGAVNLMSSDRASIFVMDGDDTPSEGFRWVVEWMTRWEGQLRIARYSSGGWEHSWDIEGPKAAIAQIPHDYLSESDWIQRTKSGWKFNRPGNDDDFSLRAAQYRIGRNR